uniref:Uncharacterized protein n=1 Tax=Anguilla anguilla TaxID=7936 RepID=A0A0E9WFR3_ANGAN
MASVIFLFLSTSNTIYILNIFELFTMVATGGCFLERSHESI